VPEAAAILARLDAIMAELAKLRAEVVAAMPAQKREFSNRPFCDGLHSGRSNGSPRCSLHGRTPMQPTGTRHVFRQPADLRQ